MRRLLACNDGCARTARTLALRIHRCKPTKERACSTKARHFYAPHVDHIESCFPAGGCRHAGQEASPVVEFADFADFVGSLRRCFATGVVPLWSFFPSGVQSCSWKVRGSRDVAFKCRFQVSRQRLTHSLQVPRPSSLRST